MHTSAAPSLASHMHEAIVQMCFLAVQDLMALLAGQHRRRRHLGERRALVAALLGAGQLAPLDVDRRPRLPMQTASRHLEVGTCMFAASSARSSASFGHLAWEEAGRGAPRGQQRCNAPSS